MVVPFSFDQIHSFEPQIQPYIECLLSESNSRINLTDEQLKIVDASSGRLPKDLGEVQPYDRFKVKIPYAEQTLTWEIIFDVANYKEPPDFIFDSENDDFYPPLEKLNSVVCWDWRNRESLVALITELLEHYKDYQLERASTNVTLQRHMRSLLAENPESLQVVINKAERGFGSVNLLMRIGVNFEKLPPYLIQDNLGQDTASLHVCFPYPESTSIQSQLFLSPSVESAFGGSNSLQIPVFQQGILLGEYLANIKKLLKNQVKLIADGFEKKKEYIAAFLSHFGKSVLEFDAQSFGKIVLLLEWNDFFFTFTVELPLYFPADHPTYVFKSVYHNQNKKPYTERHTDFPYSPRWSGNEMAKRANTYILGTIKDFQLTSVNRSDK